VASCETFAARDKDALFPLWIYYISRGAAHVLQATCSVVCNVVSILLVMGETVGASKDGKRVVRTQPK
jgi:hypothetical protein